MQEGTPQADRTLTPRGERRREALLQAARALFLERGYSGTSLSDIVARGGGSLTTLYNLFGGKEGLFRAMIQLDTDVMFGELELPRFTRDTLASGVTEMIVQMALLIQEPSRAAMQRAIVAEAAQFPDLAQAFYTGGVQKGLALFSRMLQELQADGLLQPMDPELAAICLMEPVLGHVQRRLLVGYGVPDENAIRAHAGLAVRLFLHGAATGEVAP